MTPYNPRIVFAAVVAYTDRITKDGRILSTPEGFVCPVRQLPVPVLWTPPNHNGKPRQTIPVGRIEQANVIDHRVIVFGRLDETEEIRESVVPMLQDGSRLLEIDITSSEVDQFVEPLGEDPFLMNQVGPVIFKSWKLSAAWVGTEQCWDLPRIQIEEITR